MYKLVPTDHEHLAQVHSKFPSSQSQKQKLTVSGSLVSSRALSSRPAPPSGSCAAIRSRAPPRPKSSPKSSAAATRTTAVPTKLFSSGSWFLVVFAPSSSSSPPSLSLNPKPLLPVHLLPPSPLHASCIISRPMNINEVPPLSLLCQDLACDLGADTLPAPHPSQACPAQAARLYSTNRVRVIRQISIIQVGKEAEANRRWGMFNK